MKSKQQMILVVDDDKVLLKSLCDYLSFKGYKVKGVEDGEDVLYLCKHLLPNLIISDIRMPRLDGISLLQGLKNNEPTKEIPVIFISAYADDEMKNKAKDLGARFFLAKPFPLDALDKFIDKVLDQEEKSAD